MKESTLSVDVVLAPRVCNDRVRGTNVEVLIEMDT